MLKLLLILRDWEWEKRATYIQVASMLQEITQRCFLARAILWNFLFLIYEIL